MYQIYSSIAINVTNGAFAPFRYDKFNDESKKEEEEDI
jgi:hypothetical protein